VILRNFAKNFILYLHHPIGLVQLHITTPVMVAIAIVELMILIVVTLVQYLIATVVKMLLAV